MLKPGFKQRPIFNPELEASSHFLRRLFSLNFSQELGKRYIQDISLLSHSSLARWQSAAVTFVGKQNYEKRRVWPRTVVSRGSLGSSGRFTSASKKGANNEKMEFGELANGEWELLFSEPETRVDALDWF